MTITSTMSTPTHRFVLGQATISIFNACDLKFDLAYAMKLTPETADPTFATDFREPLRLPVQCILIQLPESTVLVDAGRYAFGADSPFAIPEYQPPVAIHEQMQTADIAPTLVEQIVITHAHGDHFNALTHATLGVRADERQILSFPNAQVYLSRADWERPEVQRDRTDFTSVVSQTLVPIWQRGFLHLVDGDFELGHGVTILAAPGETQGHQVVRVESEGKVLYCLGDLYHHPYEVAHPAESVFWVDAETNANTRKQFAARACGEEALLIATHIRGVGCLTETESGVQWTDVDRVNLPK